MRQQRFSDMKYSLWKRTTKQEKFLVLAKKRHHGARIFSFVRSINCLLRFTLLSERQPKQRVAARLYQHIKPEGFAEADCVRSHEIAVCPSLEQTADQPVRHRAQHKAIL